MVSEFLVAASLLIGAGAISAQSKVPEPDFANVFVAISGTSLVPLERETETIKAGGSGFLVASAKAAYEIPGNRSPVRFHTGKPLEFLVRTPISASSVDPGTMFLLRRLDPKKNKREAVFMNGHFSPIGGSSSTNLTKGSVPVTFEKYGDSSLKLTVAGLPPGEYSLGQAYGQTVFCFGVD